MANFQLIPIGEFILNVNANPTFAAASLSGASVFPGNSIVQISQHRIRATDLKIGLVHLFWMKIQASQT